MHCRLLRMDMADWPASLAPQAAARTPAAAPGDGPAPAARASVSPPAPFAGWEGGRGRRDWPQPDAHRSGASEARCTRPQGMSPAAKTEARHAAQACYRSWPPPDAAVLHRTSPCKRARHAAAAAAPPAQPSPPRASAAGPEPGAPGIVAGEHAQRLLSQMLAALTRGSAAEQAADPNPTLSYPYPSAAAADGCAARRSAALERLAQARREPPICAGSAPGSGAAQGRPVPPAAAWGEPMRNGAQGASVLLFADGCVPAERVCRARPRAQAPPHPAQAWPDPCTLGQDPGALPHSHRGAPRPAWAVATSSAKLTGEPQGGHALPPEDAQGWGSLPAMQAGLQRLASPAGTAFPAMQPLDRAPSPGPGPAARAPAPVEGAGRGAPADGWPEAGGALFEHGARARAGGGLPGSRREGRRTEARSPAGVRAARVHVSPAARPGASWGSINAAAIAPVLPQRRHTGAGRIAVKAPVGPAASADGSRRAASKAASADVARPGSACAVGNVTRRPAAAAGEGPAGDMADAGARCEGSSGAAEARAHAAAPADVAGLLEAMRGVEALALAVQEDTRASRRVRPSCHLSRSVPLLWRVLTHLWRLVGVSGESLRYVSSGRKAALPRRPPCPHVVRAAGSAYTRHAAERCISARPDKRKDAPMK